MFFGLVVLCVILQNFGYGLLFKLTLRVVPVSFQLSQLLGQILYFMK